MAGTIGAGTILFHTETDMDGTILFTTLGIIIGTSVMSGIIGDGIIDITTIITATINVLTTTNQIEAAIEHPITKHTEVIVKNIIIQMQTQ